MFEERLLCDINPFVMWCMKIDKNDYPLSERTTKCYELEFIYWNDGGSITTDGENHILKTGDLFFRKPDTKIHGFDPFCSYVIEFSMFHYGQDYFFDPLSRTDTKQIHKEVSLFESKGYVMTKENIKFPIDFPKVMNVIQFNEFDRLFDAAYKERALERTQSTFYLKTYLMQIFMMMYKELTASNWTNHPSRSIRVNYPKIIEVRKHIDRNIKSRFKLDDLAGIVDLSPHFFSKIFKDIIGYSPIDYINKTKIASIRDVMVISNKEIKEIYIDYGFENDSHFFALFRRYTGMTPSSYRKLYQATS